MNAAASPAPARAPAKFFSEEMSKCCAPLHARPLAAKRLSRTNCKETANKLNRQQNQRCRKIAPDCRRDLRNAARPPSAPQPSARLHCLKPPSNSRRNAPHPMSRTLRLSKDLPHDWKNSAVSSASPPCAEFFMRHNGKSDFLLAHLEPQSSANRQKKVFLPV